MTTTETITRTEAAGGWYVERVTDPDTGYNTYDLYDADDDYRGTFGAMFNALRKAEAVVSESMADDLADRMSRLTYAQLCEIDAVLKGWGK